MTNFKLVRLGLYNLDLGEILGFFLDIDKFMKKDCLDDKRVDSTVRRLLFTLKDEIPSNDPFLQISSARKLYLSLLSDLLAKDDFNMLFWELEKAGMDQMIKPYFTKKLKYLV